MLTEAEILAEVKKGMSITGTFLDNTLLVYMREAILYLIDAGVKKEVIYSTASFGIITRGVSDLWANGAGGELSNYFMQRATQLAYKGGADNEL